MDIANNNNRIPNTGTPCTNKKIMTATAMQHPKSIQYRGNTRIKNTIPFKRETIPFELFASFGVLFIDPSIGVFLSFGYFFFASFLEVEK